MDRDELIARLRAMVSDDGRAIVCAGRTSREMAADIEAAAAALESRPAPTERRESVRSMDESGSPESVGCIARAWIDERAQEVYHLFGPERCEITQEPAKALILSVDRKPWYVATTWRDAMNFAQLVRWSATGGNPAVTALATDTTPSRPDLEALKDPNAVHVNLLRGGIARPSHAQIWHIYGAGLAKDMPDDVRATIAPSRDEEGSVDREAVIERIAAILLGNVNAPEQEIYRVAREIAALKTFTPETQPVAGGGQIPAGVYYIAEAGNFYAAETHKGLGNAFHAKWHARRREFPTDAMFAKPTTPERAKALEEAARVADHYAQCDRGHGFSSDRAEEIAAAIRNLKSQDEPR